GVLEEPVDRAVAEDVVGDVLEELGPVRARQRNALPAEDDLELLLQLAGELLLPDAPVVEERAELVDQKVVHPLAQLVEERIANGAGGGAVVLGLGLVEPLVEGHDGVLLGPAEAAAALLRGQGRRPGREQVGQHLERAADAGPGSDEDDGDPPADRMGYEDVARDVALAIDAQPPRALL